MAGFNVITEVAGSIDQNRITLFRQLRILHRPQRNVQGRLQERPPPIILFIRSVEVRLRVGQPDIVAHRQRFWLDFSATDTRSRFAVAQPHRLLLGATGR